MENVETLCYHRSENDRPKQSYSIPRPPPISGDVRMYFGENPDKVKNIVTNTLGRFQDLYAPVLKVRGFH